MELYRSVAYSPLTLNKLLGSYSRQKKEIDVILLAKKKIPSLPQPSIKNYWFLIITCNIFNFENANGLKKSLRVYRYLVSMDVHVLYLQLY